MTVLICVKFQTKAHKSPFYLGDLVTRTGEQEISVVFRRLPADNPEELA